MHRSFLPGLIALSILCWAGPAAAQTVDQIVARNLQARGGVEKLKALATVKSTGSVVQQGTTVRMVTWAKRPNMMRREMQAVAPPPPPDAARGSMPPRNPALMKAVVAFDGTTAWMINPMMGDTPQQITGPGADASKQGADFDSVLLDYKAKGHTVELLGNETINGKPAYHLKITQKNGQVQNYYLDQETALEVRTGTIVDQGGTKAEVTTDLSDYRAVEGLMMPFAMRQAMNGQTLAEVTIDKWEVNVPFEDEIFRMPVKK